MSTIPDLTPARQFRSFTVDDLDPLKWWLYGRHYTIYSVYRILDHVAANGTLAGLVPRDLDRADEEQAYEVLEGCFPPVGDSPWDWDLFSEADRWELGAAIPRVVVLSPPELEDAEGSNS